MNLDGNLNHSIEELSPEHLERNVRQRIKQLHMKRKPRSDAVGLADIIVGASSDFMLQLGTEKREQYFANALYASSGVLFKSEDRDHVELPTQDFITLRQIADLLSEPEREEIHEKIELARWL